MEKGYINEAIKLCKEREVILQQTTKGNRLLLIVTPRQNEGYCHHNLLAKHGEGLHRSYSGFMIYILLIVEAGEVIYHGLSYMIDLIC